jgi:hypothetical protein
MNDQIVIWETMSCLTVPYKQDQRAYYTNKLYRTIQKHFDRLLIVANSSLYLEKQPSCRIVNLCTQASILLN